MTAGLPDSALELRSTVTSQGTLDLSLHDVPVQPAANEVVGTRGSLAITRRLGRPHAGADMTSRDCGGHTGTSVVTASLGAGCGWQGFRRASTNHSCG